MSAREKVDALLAEVLPKIEELEAEALARVREVEVDARQKIARVEEARKELAKVEAELESMREEREGLPNRAYRAGLDENYTLEDDLKECYQNLKPAIEACEERRDELRAELSGLLPKKGPNNEPHPLDAKIHHTARVAEIAQSERVPLEHLRDRLTKAANSTAESVAKRHDENRAQVMAWGNSIQWERSPSRGYRPPGKQAGAA